MAKPWYSKEDFYMQGGTYRAYTVIECNYRTGQHKEFCFKFGGTIESMWITFLSNIITMLKQVFGELFFFKIAQMRDKRDFRRGEFEEMINYHRAFLKMYNEMVSNTQLFVMDCLNGRDDKETVEETIERILSKYIEEPDIVTPKRFREKVEKGGAKYNYREYEEVEKGIPWVDTLNPQIKPDTWEEDRKDTERRYRLLQNRKARRANRKKKDIVRVNANRERKKQERYDAIREKIDE